MVALFRMNEASRETNGNQHLSYEGTYASVKSLLSRNYMHHVDLSETRKSPKG